MPLSINQKRHLYEHGYVHLPGIIPPPMVAAALRAINHSLGNEGMNKDQLPVMRSQTYCRELSDKPVLLDLFNATPAFECAESAVGRGKLPRNGWAQVGLRFPTLAETPGGPHAHIDGMYSPLNGVPEGTIGHFTLLAAVFLSDVLEPNQGNFTVWPGTHRRFEAYFREHTPQILLQGMPKVEMPEPRQIMARAGDVVLTHYQLAHSVAPHVGPNIRYALFFRFTGIDHASFGWNVMTDIWAEWEGMRDVVSEGVTA